MDNPWWLPKGIAQVPVGVTTPQIRLLGVVALALLFEEYDMAMLNLALPQIASDLGIAVGELPEYMWLIRVGALPAFFLIPYADRLGRRPVFIGSTALMGLFTFATAFAQTPLQFALCQGATRAFFLSGSAVAFVIVTEQYPAQHRGWGLGVLSALGAVGHGLSAGLYAAVSALPYGWRALYGLGLVPLLLTPLFLSRIGETDRFRAHAAAAVQTTGGDGLLATLRPLWALVRSHPVRAFGLGVSGFAVAFGTLPSFQFASLFAQQHLGWKPGQVSMMVIGSGAVGILGNIVAGRLGDTFGRRRVGAVLTAGFPAMSALFYNAGLAPLVVFAFGGMVFCLMGGRVMLRALATEMFPTSQRGAASGLYSVLEQVGALIGLFVLARNEVSDAAGLSLVLPAIALSLWVGSLVILTFPETRGMELESVE